MVLSVLVTKSEVRVSRSERLGALRKEWIVLRVHREGMKRSARLWVREWVAVLVRATVVSRASRHWWRAFMTAWFMGDAAENGKRS